MLRDGTLHVVEHMVAHVTRSISARRRTGDEARISEGWVNSKHTLLGIVTVFCEQQCHENSASWIITVLLFIRTRIVTILFINLTCIWSLSLRRRCIRRHFRINLKVGYARGRICEGRICEGRICEGLLYCCSVPVNSEGTAMVGANCLTIPKCTHLQYSVT